MDKSTFIGFAMVFFLAGTVMGINIANLIHMRRGK